MKKGVSNQILLFVSITILLFATYFIVYSNNANSSTAVFNVDNLKLYSENYSTISTSVSVDREVQPDYFTINLGVKVESENIEEGKSIVSEKINSIRKKLYSIGLKKEEVETLNFNIYKNYYWYEGKRDFKNYTIIQTLRVKSHNLDLAGKVIDEAVKEGANSIGSLTFNLDDKTVEEVKKELLKEAVKKAYEQANIVCENGNLKLEGIKTLNINSYNYNPYPVYYAKAEAVMNDNSNTIIDSQSRKVSLSINVVFNAKMK